MIWDPGVDGDKAASPLVLQIESQIRKSCGNGPQPSDEGIHEVARAVELALEKHGETSAPGAEYLARLVAQALASVGHGEAARRLFIFGTGMVTPSEWDVSGGDTVWVLDLRKIDVQRGTCLEMLFFKMLDMVLNAVADVWDASGGTGALGLRHVSRTATALCGGKPRDGLDLALDIKHFCSRRMARIGERRGWKDRPRIMDLDL